MTPADRDSLSLSKQHTRFNIFKSRDILLIDLYDFLALLDGVYVVSATFEVSVAVALGNSVATKQNPTRRVERKCFRTLLILSL